MAQVRFDRASYAYPGAGRPAVDGLDLTIEEIAEAQGSSPRTVKRNWAYARAWLGRELADYDPPRS